MTKLWFEHSCMIQVDILQIQKCTAGYCTHTHTHTHRWGGGGINYMQIWRDVFSRLAWKKMLILSDEHHTVTSSTVLGPWKKKLVVQRSLFCGRYAEGSGVRITMQTPCFGHVNRCGLVQCCLRSSETIRTIRDRGAQDVHLDFHT